MLLILWPTFVASLSTVSGVKPPPKKKKKKNLRTAVQLQRCYKGHGGISRLICYSLSWYSCVPCTPDCAILQPLPSQVSDGYTVHVVNSTVLVDHHPSLRLLCRPSRVGCFFLFLLFWCCSMCNYSNLLSIIGSSWDGLLPFWFACAFVRINIYIYIYIYIYISLLYSTLSPLPWFRYLPRRQCLNCFRTGQGWRSEWPKNWGNEQPLSM